MNSVPRPRAGLVLDCPLPRIEPRPVGLQDHIIQIGLVPVRRKNGQGQGRRIDVPVAKLNENPFLVGLDRVAAPAVDGFVADSAAVQVFKMVRQDP